MIVRGVEVDLDARDAFVWTYKVFILAVYEKIP
jgi:hypothetical protein